MQPRSALKRVADAPRSTPAWRRRLCGHLFEGRRVVAALITGSAFTAGAVLDLATPRYLTFGAFYVIVVAYASWMLGRRAGWAAALAAVAVSLASDGFGGYLGQTTGTAYAIAVAWGVAMRLLSAAGAIELTRGFRRSFDHARELGDRDALTELLNPRAFRTAAERSMARTHRGGRSVALLYGDLDGFKSVNDRLGHAAGDQVLTLTARTLAATLRPSDVIGRIGGDEFVMLLEVESDAAAFIVVQRLRYAISEKLEQLGQVSVSCSFRVAMVQPADPLPEIDLLIARADKAMYQVKAERRADQRSPPPNRGATSIRDALRHISESAPN